MTPVFDTYWRFAVERQSLFFRRLSGAPYPWTTDAILEAHRFTNTYRASDRVSQFLIRHVLYSGDQSEQEVVFRCLLFKLFNRIETWDLLVEEVGQPSWRRFDVETYARALDRRREAGQPVYSAAYIMPSPGLGAKRKHRNHLLLLEHMMKSGLPSKAVTAPDLATVFSLILKYPSMGPFLAFQYTIDLNYSTAMDFCESDFVVAGPGAQSGIRKCFSDTAGLTDEEIIHAMTDIAEREFDRLGLEFPTLWGRRLHPIDCQNLFCEVDKYSRVAHPEMTRHTGRTRIKQRFKPNPEPLPQWYPPKWGLNPTLPKTESLTRAQP